jgi:hypothetical protein
MSNKGQIHDDNYFNGWVIAGIFISIVSMMIMANEMSSDHKHEMFYMAVIGLSSLVIVGAVAILIGMAKLGAILIIIGGIAMTPIGVIAAIGGVKILQLIEYNRQLAKTPDEQAAFSKIETEAASSQQPVDTPSTEPSNIAATENPLHEFKAEHYGPNLPLGLFMTFAGFVMMLLGVMHGGTLFGFGIVNIVIAFIANSSKIRFYENRMEVKMSANWWQKIFYDDVIHLGSPSDRNLILEYKFGDKVKSIVFASSLWGEVNISRIYEAISEHVASDKLCVSANNGLVPVKATLVSVEKIKQAGESGQNPYQILTQWKEPNGGETRLFRSKNIGFDPTKYIEGNTIIVFVDLSDPSNYRMDVSFLPDYP